MSTLKQLVEAAKCRKGEATGTTKAGAFWLAGRVKIRSCGGDGIGQSGSDVNYYLSLRHYRGGEVRAVVSCNVWHENDGSRTTYRTVEELLRCTTVEELEVELKKGVDFDGGGGVETVYGDYHADDLSEILTGLGMPESAPAPDETPVVQ